MSFNSYLVDQLPRTYYKQKGPTHLTA